MQQPKTGNIGIIPLFSIIVLAIGLMNHVIVLPPLLQAARRDAWISVLAMILPYAVWVAALYFIIRKTGRQPILPWLQQRFGTAVSFVFRSFFVVYLFFVILLTLKDTTMWTHGSYLPRTPLLALSISLVAVCCLAVYCGIRAIAFTAGLLLPFVIIFGDFVMTANLPAKNYSLLKPILENGVAPIAYGMIHIGGGLAELVIFLLFQHQMKTKIRFVPFQLLGLFLVLLCLGPVMGAIAEFGPYEAASLRYPAYEEWRLVRIGRYIRHMDFLSIYQWLSGATIRISISLLLLVELLSGKLQNNRVRLMWSLGLGAIAVVLVELPVSDMQYLYFLTNFYLPGSLIAASVVLLILFLLAWISSRTKEKPNGA